MQHALFVGIIQPAGNAAGHPDDFFGRQCALVQPFLERFSLHKAHHQIGIPFMFGKIIDWHNVAMLQPGHHLGFAGKAAQEAVVVFEDSVQHLDGHMAV